MIQHMTTQMLTMCSIVHMSHPQGPSSLSAVLTKMWPIDHVPHWPCIKMLKRCEVIKKMSICQKDVKYQKVNHHDYGGGSHKK